MSQGNPLPLAVSNGHLDISLHGYAHGLQFHMYLTGTTDW